MVKYHKIVMESLKNLFAPTGELVDDNTIEDLKDK